jgi:ligand-binding sensor domain-containing protein
MKKLSIAFILVVVTVHILAQLTDYHQKKIIQSVGLYKDMITRIYQNSKGFMWFGSSRGRIRYKGSEFRIFRHTGDATSLLVTQF